MSKESKLYSAKVEVKSARPSRIRRDPPAQSRVRRDPAPEPSRLSKIDWNSREWEMRLSVAGIIFFALAISALVIDIGELLSQ